MLTPHFLGGGEKVTISKTKKTTLREITSDCCLLAPSDSTSVKILPWQVWGRIDAELE